VLQLQQAILSGDWGAATTHIGRLDIQGSPQALQVRLQLLWHQRLQRAGGRAGSRLSFPNPQLLRTGWVYNSVACLLLIGACWFTTPLPPQEAKFIILEQAFLEAVNRGDSAAALTCLREQLAPLGADRERLHQLAACLMGGGGAAAAELGSVPAVGTSEARHEVLQRLQASGQWPALPQLGLLLASLPAGCAPLLRCRLAQHTARCRRRCRTAAGGCAC
jgi:hypothetical protein